MYAPSTERPLRRQSKNRTTDRSIGSNTVGVSRRQDLYCLFAQPRLNAFRSIANIKQISTCLTGERGFVSLVLLFSLSFLVLLELLVLVVVLHQPVRSKSGRALAVVTVVAGIPAIVAAIVARAIVAGIGISIVLIKWHS